MIDVNFSPGLVVADAMATASNFSTLLGIDSWDVRELHTSDRLRGSVVDGRPEDFGLLIASGSVPDTNIHFELVQPLYGHSTYHRKLLTVGEGVSHLLVPPSSLSEPIPSVLAEQQHLAFDGVLARRQYATEADLGFALEVMASDLGESTGVWSFDGASVRPSGRGPLPVVGLEHYGVVVHDSHRAAQAYSQLLGLHEWDFICWQTVGTRLTDATYYGLPVEHGYFCGMHLGEGYGFELIQPTFGPSHYNRDFLDVRGPGVHHLCLLPEHDSAAWSDTVEWMTSLGAPVVMSGTLLDGAFDYAYFDTRKLLGGWVLEAWHRYRDVPLEEQRDWHLTVDFRRPRAR